MISKEKLAAAERLVKRQTKEEKFAEAQKRLDADPRTANLKMIRTKEEAKAMQQKSVEARRRNKERITTLKEFWKDFTAAGLEIENDDIKGLDILKFLMKKAIHDEDYELAGQYAEKIAQYETPKLASQQVVQTNIELKDLSDEEFAAELAKLESPKKNTGRGQ